MKEGFKARIGFVYWINLFFAAIIVTRLFFVQVVKKDFYDGKIDARQSSAAESGLKRGVVYFKDKNGNPVSAAVVKKGYQLVINPQALDNPKNAYDKISTLVNLAEEDFMAKAAKKNDTREVVMRKIEDEKADQIKKMAITGVSFEPNSWRYYPSGSLASHVLGFVGFKGNDLVGRYGIEKYYENFLSKKEESGGINSFLEIFKDVKGLISGGLPGGDIYLTIEPVIQSTLEKNLEKTLNKYGGGMAGGIIIAPKTGAITAMAAKPDFDPNQYAKVKDFSVFMNPLVENVFEMGSIMKPLTLAASMDSGSIKPDTIYEDKGFVNFGPAQIKNYDGKARGMVDMQKVLDESLNTGAVFAMQKMDKDKFSRYMLDYGLGEKTGIDLPNEVSGKVSNIVGNKREIEYATASFGQGIAVTPIEMTIALSTLANGGVLMKPQIVEEENAKGLVSKKSGPKEIRRVLKEETAEEITRMLVKVVDEALLEGKYKMEHYSVAAKTGTAQIVEHGKNSYQEGEYLHTFFGYAPAFDPRFLVFLFIYKPQGVRYAAHSLTEPFMDISKFLINYYEIPPDR